MVLEHLVRFGLVVHQRLQIGFGETGERLICGRQERHRLIAVLQDLFHFGSLDDLAQRAVFLQAVHHFEDVLLRRHQNFVHLVDHRTAGLLVEAGDPSAIHSCSIDDLSKDWELKTIIQINHSNLFRSMFSTYG